MTLTVASPPAEVAAAIITESRTRGHSRDESIAELSTAKQESGLRMVKHPTADWWGYYQQDSSYPNRRDPLGNIRGFMDRLDRKRASPGASRDPFKNIFWLQQRPSDPTADAAFARGRKAYYDEIRQHTDWATDIYDRLTGGHVAAWTGDPTWLDDVLLPALGDRLKAIPGWKDAGHGDFRDIRGVMVHHTGNSKESALSIKRGRPDLEGPLANLHIAPDGTVTIVAVGVCWHAGVGSYPWLPTDNANYHMIGIECAWPDIRSDGTYDAGQRWPDKQIISMRDTCAALVKKLGFDASRVIGHKEWAGSAQGKWDPGNIDMNWFRGEVTKDLAGQFDPKPDVPPTPQPGPILPPADYGKLIYDQLRIEWPQIGAQTLVNAVGEIRDKVLGVTDYADWKAGK